MELNSTKMTLTESKAELLRSVARMYYIPVSYTHLDVYKRQIDDRVDFGARANVNAGSWLIENVKLCIAAEPFGQNDLLLVSAA